MTKYRTNFVTAIFIGLILFTVGKTNAAGDNPIRIESHSYHVSLRLHGKHVCSAAIISQLKVLTSARCALLFQPLAQGKQIYGSVHTGSVDSEHLSKPHKIVRIYVHPWYQSSSSRHDIAIVKVDTPFGSDKKRDTAFFLSNDPDEGMIANVTGWRDTPNNLQKASMKVISNTKCQKSLKTTIFPEQVCAVNIDGYSVLQNDGGSPLVSDRMVIGVASCADSLCAQGPPNVYTRIASYMNFAFSLDSPDGYDPRRDNKLSADPRHPNHKASTT